MCWSATADLAGGSAVAATGVAAVLLVRRRPLDIPLAALPVLLGAHQIVEAVVWDSGGGCGPATLTWAVIALPLLPLWLPLAVFAAVPAARRRVVLPLCAGVLTSAFLAHALATRPVTAEIRGHTVGYAVGLPYGGLLLTGYLCATLGAALLSGDRLLVLFGALASVGAVVSAVLWRHEFVSAWCAVAAVCSLILLAWAWERRRTPSAADNGGRP